MLPSQANWGVLAKMAINGANRIQFLPLGISLLLGNHRPLLGP
jgi:hypothetical protein